MSTTPDNAPPGAGNRSALKAWDHLNRRLSEALPRNVRHADRIALRIVHSKWLRKAG